MYGKSIRGPADQWDHALQAHLSYEGTGYFKCKDIAGPDMYHIYPYKRPRGQCIFQKGGPACIMAGEPKILETNLKSEEIINYYLVFLQILMHL